MRRILFCLWAASLFSCDSSEHQEAVHNTDAALGSDAGLAGEATDPAACAPTACALWRWNCGTMSDGCGHDLNCGTCTAPEVCGGGGVPHVCGRSDAGP